MMHAALDRLEELLGGKNNTVARWQRGSHWIGVICRMEHTEIYGYVTASNVKLLVMIRQDEIIPMKKTKESDIKLLFVRTNWQENIGDSYYIALHYYDISSLFDRSFSHISIYLYIYE
jgi:hypothetical protein